ncbi:MAG: hypothetical protein P4L54_02910 [Acidocella sp.]|nr:hypothetical protein [Acidocella sp.]
MLTQTRINHTSHGHTDHDDGLVHSHSWTSAEAPHAGRRRAAMEKQAAAARPQHHDHDDGLVHSHSWAVSSPER